MKANMTYTMKQQHKPKQSLVIFFIFLLGQLLINNAYADLADDAYLCNKASNKGDFSQALILSEKILKQDSHYREGLLCKGRALGGLGQLEDGIASIKAAEKLSTSPFEHIVALTLLGNLQKNAKRYPEAMVSYKQSLSIAEASNNAQFQRIDNNLLGEVSIENHQIQAGLDYYLAGQKFVANDNERADNYQRLATTYSLLKQHDLAIENQVRALLMQKQSGTLDDYASASLELGRIYTAAGDYVNAEKTFNKLIQFSQENGGAYYEAKATFYAGLAKSASGDNVTAKTLFANASRIANQVGDAELIKEINHANHE